MTLTKLLKAAIAAGHTLECYYPDEQPDYRGKSVKDAKEALEACDIMNLAVIDDNTGKTVGWAMIVNDCTFEPEEQIADYSGEWMDKIMENA